MKASIKCFVHYEPNEYAPADAPLVFAVYPFDMSEHNRVLLSVVDVEFEIPDGFNPKLAEIAGLEKQLDLLAEKYHTGAVALRERISKLLCIENSPSGDA